MVHDVFFSIITIGMGEPLVKDEDFTITSIGCFEWNLNTFRKEPTAKGTFRELETITFFGVDGTIELFVHDTIIYTLNIDGNIVGIDSEGSIVGHGKGTLKA